MLGRRNPQRSFFDAQSVPNRVPPDSFYGRMGAVSDVLFSDEDLAMMYSPDNGRPSLPPSLLSGVLLLQFYDGVSDGEAVQRLLFDLRWKVALNLPLDYAGFDPSSLTYFRKRLVENGQERYAFSRLIAVGREAGFIPDRVTLLTDTTNVKGAGAVQDTYTLLRKGTRKLLKAAGFALPGKRRGLSPQTRDLVERYVDQDSKADIDWADPQQRLAQLQMLVADAEAALELAMEQSDDEVRYLGWLLTKILGDDLETDEQGQSKIGQGTAPDRIISLTEPEMRHGRKSKAHRFDGFKAVVSTEQSSELILDFADVTASGSDGAHLMPTIERTEAEAKVTVERAIGDGAFGSGKNRAACADYRDDDPIDLVSPVAKPSDPEVHKSAFEIDLEAQTATCPQGHTVTGNPGSKQDGLPTMLFIFPRATCEACPLFKQCVRSKKNGRSICAGPYEANLQEARARQQTEEFKTIYRLRPAVERKIGELVRHGLRDTRYIGEPKRQLQRLWLGAAVNLKRLFTLAQAQGVDLHTLLSHLEPRQAGLIVT